MGDWRVREEGRGQEFIYHYKLWKVKLNNPKEKLDVRMVYTRVHISVNFTSLERYWLKSPLPSKSSLQNSSDPRERELPENTFSFLSKRWKEISKNTTQISSFTRLRVILSFCPAVVSCCLHLTFVSMLVNFSNLSHKGIPYGLLNVHWFHSVSTSSRTFSRFVNYELIFAGRDLLMPLLLNLILQCVISFKSWWMSREIFCAKLAQFQEFWTRMNLSLQNIYARVWCLWVLLTFNAFLVTTIYSLFIYNR